MGFRLAMEAAKHFLDDSFVMLGSVLDGRPGVVAGLQTLARNADNESLSNEVRDDNRIALRQTVDNLWNPPAPAVAREDIIAAYDFAREHDPMYQGTESDLLAMLEDVELA
jgi:hypothetical protein